MDSHSDWVDYKAGASSSSCAFALNESSDVSMIEDAPIKDSSREPSTTTPSTHPTARDQKQRMPTARTTRRWAA